MNYIIFIGGICLGWLLNHLFSKLIIHLSNLNYKKDVNGKFLEILNNIKSGRSKFKSRVNHTVFIESHLNNTEINVVWMMEEELICIFQDDKCLWTSTSIDDNIKKDILMEINKKYYNTIYDTVNINGVIVSKFEYEIRQKEMQDQIQEHLKNIQSNINLEDEIEEMKKENENKFDVDSILDKIYKFGIESITKEEKDFLDNFKNK